MSESDPKPDALAGSTVPQRIQLRRTRGWRLPPSAVVVARPSRWGNPFRVGVDGVSRDEAVATYRRAMTEGGAGLPSAQEVREALRGRDLACWCPLSGPCHADVLLDIANR